MTARFVADTNVAVYALDADPQRHERALSIMRRHPVISTQVVNEFISVLTGKHRVPRDRANRYARILLDLWVSHRVRPQCQGEADYFRCADDFVAGFQDQQEAQRFHVALGERLAKFKLRLAEDKDAVFAVWALRPTQCAGARWQARGVYFSRLHPRLRQDQEGSLQGQAPHQPQEARGQRKAYNWDGYNAVLRQVQWPRVRIRIDLNPFRRAEAC